MRKIAIILFLTGYYFCPNVVLAKFGSDGKTTTSIAGDNDYAYGITLQPDGKLVLAGRAGSLGSALIRYTSNGTLDTEFNGTGILTGSYYGDMNSVLVQPDGKIVAAGGTGGQFALTRININGGYDTNFGLFGRVYTDFDPYSDLACSVVVKPNGKLVVSGYSSLISGRGRFALARYTANGDLDTAFNGTGKVITCLSQGSGNAKSERAYSVIVQPDGKIVAAGNSTTGEYMANSDFATVRYNSDGTLDTTFNGTGIAIAPFAGVGYAYSMLIQPDNKLVVAGASPGGLTLIRYNSDGSLDTSFNGIGKVTNAALNAAYSVLIQPDGKIVAAGDYNNGSNKDFALARYNSNGTLDTTFNGTGMLTMAIGSGDDIAKGAVLQPDDKIVAAGYSYNGANYDIALIRCNGNGTPDTQADPPIVLEVKPGHATAGRMVTLDIRGWNLDEVIAVQLRNSSGSINGTDLTVINPARITAQFALPAAPGLYDVYAAKNSVNRTFKGVFFSQMDLSQPVRWEFADLGKAGSPIVGPANIAIGDADGDGAAEIYVANSDNRMYAYINNGGWTISPLPLESSFVQDVLLADEDLDGSPEVYGVNTAPRVVRYVYSGGWTSNSISAYTGPLAQGTMIGGTFKALYGASGNMLTQMRPYNNNWINTTVRPCGGALLCSVAGDADNNQFTEVYAATGTDHKIVQFPWGNSWGLPTTVFSGSTNTACLAIGDLDRNGANELYGGNLDGYIYQFKWNGTSWTNLPVNGTTLTANKIAIGDCDNDGQDELYAAGQNGHAYEFDYNGAGWDATDLGDAGVPLIALALGDGDNSHQSKVYAVGNNAHLYQFYAVSIPHTPTPTVTISPTPGPTLTPTPTTTSSPTPVMTSERDSMKKLLVVNGKINPLKGQKARIRWYQPNADPVTLIIYNLLGDEVKRLADKRAFAQDQFQEICWDGRSNNGAAVGSGIYIVYIQSGDCRENAKIAVLK